MRNAAAAHPFACAVRAALLSLGLASVALCASCTQKETKHVVLHRDNCLVCHRPLDDAGNPHGIEEAHSAYPLKCQDCHGGNPRICDGTMGADADGNPTCDGEWVYDKDRAHVSPGTGPKYLKNLSAFELDQIDPDYLRFVNPGDFRVLDKTCGTCHADIAERMKRSTMAHTAGEIAVARYRAGAQEHPEGLYGALDVADPDADPNNLCAQASYDQFNPPPMALDSTDPATEPTVANAQDQYMVKSCFRCHLSDFGQNKFEGDYRSSGCTACHMPYADDGRSHSDDPMVSKQTVPHPAKHELVRSPPIDACTHCHYRGGRLGIGFQGYRESAGKGLNPANPGVLGVSLHGHDANYYLTDEDTTNDFDETPPDVHFEAGMHCVDCHTEKEIHGDGHLYSDTQCAVKTECTDCHGTVREYAKPSPDRPNLFERDGKLYLRTKVTNLELEVTQTKDVVTPGHPRYSKWAEIAMGVDENGYSHTDDLECYTCHAGWIPTCYGCHVEVDMGREKRYHTTGKLVAGHPTGTRRWVQLFDLVLMRNTDGMIAPSMPSERFFMTIKDLDGNVVLDSSPRVFTTPDGRKMPGFGQRAFNPHTTVRKSPFMACDRCHSVGSADNPDNAVLLDLTHGFGTDRLMQDGCDVSNDDPSCNRDTDWTTYRLDAIQDRDGTPLVVVGHPYPHESRPLTLDEIQRMRAVVVDPQEPYRTDIPPDADTRVDWPGAKKMPEGPTPPPKRALVR